MTTLRNILKDTQGATAIEYALLAGLIAMAIMVAVSGFADEVNRLWTHVGTTISSGISGG